MRNCECKRIIDPAGTWEYCNMIGAMVKILSIPVGDFKPLTKGTNCIIEDVYFRISTDGKVITVVKLKEYPDFLFTFKDLEIIEVNNNCENNE